MAYQQTTASSIDDMLNTIATFSAALGWTVARNNTFTSGSNTRRILSLSRAGLDHVHLFTDLSSTTKTNLFAMRSIDINTSVDVLSQPNRSTYPQVNLLSGGSFPNFYLFGEDGANPYVHCVIEHAAGRFRHFGFGELVKQGSWTGGSYATGTFWSQVPVYANNHISNYHSTPWSDHSGNVAVANTASIRCDDSDAAANNISGVDNRYLPYDNGTSYPRRVGTGFRTSTSSSNIVHYVDYGMGLLDYTFSVYNQRTNLIRLKHFVSVSGGFFRYIGEPPAVRAINISPYQNGEEFTIGSDVWKVFPIIRKGSVANQEYSGNYGIAYKKVV